MPDETVASSSEADDKEKLDAQDTDSDPEESEGIDSPKAKTQRRFQQILQEREEARQRADRLQQFVDERLSQFGTPEEISEFTEWRKERAQAQKAADDGELTPQQLAQVKRAIDKAYPEISQMRKDYEAAQQDRADAMYESAQEEIKNLAEKVGIGTDEKSLTRLAGLVLMEIKTDEKLSRLWRAGNLKCIENAFKAVDEQFLHTGKTKGLRGQAEDAREKRRVVRVPTIPTGSPATRSGSPAPREKGITKETHERAFAILQQGGD
jgi:hypothetical protein